VPPGLAVPPGLDAPQPYSAVLLGTEAPALSSAAPIHAWALEAKIKAEQAQERQRQWAEKQQMQYIQGQNILKALKKADGERPEGQAVASTLLAKDSGSEGAFDRLVKQMGLKTETPRCTGQGESPVGQTPPAKQQAFEAGTPPKAGERNRREGRRTGEKENLPSPTAPRRNRGGRRGQTYQ